MKKSLALLFAMVLALSVVGCSSDVEDPPSNGGSASQEAPADTSAQDDEPLESATPTEETFDFSGTTWSYVAYLEDDGTRLEGEEFQTTRNVDNQRYEFRADGVFCSYIADAEQLGTWEQSGAQRVRVVMDGSGITMSGKLVDGELHTGPDILDMMHVFALAE